VSEIFWIKGEPQVPLAIVMRPRADELLRDDLIGLKRGGIDTVISLLEKDEAAWLGLAEEDSIAMQVGLNFLSHPIPDVHVPENPIVFRVFVAGLADRLLDREHIGIHCRGSIGRSTVTAACILIHLGWTPRDALAAVEEARGCAVPDTLEQELWILHYNANLSTPGAPQR
jgi:protein-tyrosine phosphatase